MKKLMYSLLAMALTAMTFSSCEDVPMPYDMPTADNDTTSTTTTPSGSGTQDDPFNVAAAQDYITAGENLDQAVYVKGKIVSVQEIDTSYGNATYYISDDGTTTNQLEVYRGYALGNKHFSSDDEIKAGDEVIVYGKLVNYSGTYEFTQGNYIYSLNGSTGEDSGSGSTTEPSGEGTEASPYNVAKAQSIIAAGSYTSDKVYISGTISKIDEISTDYGNATYYISDDGTTTGQLEVYRGYYLNGDKFTSESQIKVGDQVVIYGALTSYSGTPEVTTGSQIISLNSGSNNNGGSDEEGGESITAAATDMGFTDKAAAGTTTLSDGTTLTFAIGDGTTAPAYYAGSYASVRMYAMNTLTITASKKIVKIAITTTDGYNGTLYNGNDKAYATDGSTQVNINKVSDTEVTFSGLNGSTVTLVNDYTANKGGTQLRIKSITITYAK